MTPSLNNSKSLIKTEFQKSIALSIPLAASQLAQSATGFVDTVMMGWMGPETLAAGGLAAAMVMTLWVSGLGLTNGVTALAAEAYGRNDPDRIRNILHQGIVLAGLIALPAIVLLSQGEVLLRISGQSFAIAHLAQTYLSAIAWGYFPSIAFVLLRGIASSMNQPRMPMVIAIGGLIFNAVGNYLLGFGKFGFPVMGLTGLAIATAATHWLMMLSLLFYLLLSPIFKSLKLRLLRLDLPLLWQLIKLGLPIGISFAAEVGLFTVTTVLMGRFGVSVLAAHQVVFQTIAMIFMLPLGVSYATTIRVGQGLGQNNIAGIKRSAFVGIFLGGGVMAIAATLLILFPKVVLSLYLDLSLPVNQALVPIATSMLTVAALAQILDGVQTTAAGALRGLQDTRVPMVLSFVAFWMVGLASGVGLGFGLGWGGVGLWIGQSIGITMASVLFVTRFLALLKRLECPGE
jgi:multidrug resistance protein, MATE family